ncbi:MAG TPA: phosphatidate cytidylyltransferase [Gemmatimonadaceae bacterium]|nr:phosphatidate cytidylyltransferase [Gemmatimonadaceae bacterium]
MALYVVVAGGAALAALLAIASAIGAWEYYRIARATGQTPMDDIGIALAGLIPLVVHARFLGIQVPAIPIAAVAFVSILGLAIWRRGVEGRPLGAAATTIVGAIYTGGMLSFGYALRYHPYAFAEADVGGMSIASGALLLMLPMLVTWASDTGAYAVGRAMGRRKLIPTVSPGKTVEGAIGGILASVLVAWAFGTYVLKPSAQLGFKWFPWGIILFGVAISIAAQIGDLFESLIKREAGVKDSSRILPGHGGILDRLDSMFFVLPVSFLLIQWLLTWVPR